MNRNRWIAATVVTALVIAGVAVGVGVYTFQKMTPPPAKVTKVIKVIKKVTKAPVPVPTVAPTPPLVGGTRVKIDVSTPVETQVKVNVEVGAVPPVPAPAPAAVLSLPPAVTTPPASPAVQPQSMPAPLVPCLHGQTCTDSGMVISQPKPLPPAERVQPSSGGTQILSNNTLQLRIGVLNNTGGYTTGYGAYGYGNYYGYGNGYGWDWSPGHMERICESRSTGTVCFDRWVGHPLPGTLNSPY